VRFKFDERRGGLTISRKRERHKGLEAGYDFGSSADKRETRMSK